SSRHLSHRTMGAASCTVRSRRRTRVRHRLSHRSLAGRAAARRRRGTKTAALQPGTFVGVLDMSWKGGSRMGLYEKWRPMQFDELLGQGHAVKLMRALARAPDQRAKCWLFVGDSGLGKTTLALVTASALGCVDEMSGLYYVGPGEFRIERAKDLWQKLHYTPLLGSGWKVRVIDEGHDMSPEAADFLLAGLERNMPPKTVIFITCNSDKWASKALKSRLMVVTFDGTDPELKREAVARLAQVWDIETSRRRPAPNFAS